MSWVIVLSGVEAQSPPMTSEEDMPVDRLRQLFRSRVSGAQGNAEAERRRSNRMRYFLTVFGAQHWAERVEGRRIPARRGDIAR
jgi:hypothetical protein